MSSNDSIISRATFIALNNHYQAVEKSIRMVKFRCEFAGLLGNFQKAYRSQERLLNKIKEMGVIKELAGRKEEATAAKALVDTPADNQLVKEYIELRDHLNVVKQHNIKLTKERDELKETNERFAPFLPAIVDKMAMLAKTEKKDEHKEPTIMLKAVALGDFQIELEHTRQRMKDLIREKTEDENRIEKLNNTIKALSGNFQKANKANEHLVDEAAELHKNVEAANREADRNKQIVEDHDERLDELKQRYQEQFDFLKKVNEELKNTNKKCSDKLSIAFSEKGELSQEIKDSNYRISCLNKKIDHFKANNDTLGRRVEELNMYISEHREKGQLSIGLMKSLQRELQDTNDKLKNSMETMEESLKERDFYRSEAIRWEKACASQRHEIVAVEERKRSLLVEVYQNKQKIASLNKRIKETERDAISIVEETKALKKLIEEKQASFRNYVAKSINDKELFAELQQELKMRTSNWQELCDDRIMFKKFYEASKSAHLLQKYENVGLSSYNNHLTEVIRDKDKVNRKVTKMKNKLEIDYENIKNNLKENEKSAEKMNLNMKILRNKDKATRGIVKKQQIKLDSQEKHIEKLITKNKTLESKHDVKISKLRELDEKYVMRERELVLSKEECRNALEDVKSLKYEIEQVARKNKLLEEKVSLMPQLRQEIFQMQDQLQEEKMKTKALEDTGKKQRMLREKKTKDPDYLEMLFKNEFLQKNNLQQMNQLKKSQTELVKKERYIEELTVLLKRQPEEDVAVRLLECRKKVSNQKQTIKALMTEVNMYESLISNHQGRVDRDHNLHIRRD